MAPVEMVLRMTVFVQDLSLFPTLELGASWGLWVTCRSPHTPGGLQPELEFEPEHFAGLILQTEKG